MILVFLWIGIFIIALSGMIKSSDYFTDSAEIIGKKFGLPSFIIGVTIVSIGTSLPELLTAIFGVLEGSSEIVIGDVVGSNITNIFLGLGILPLIAGYVKISKDLSYVDFPILLGSTLIIAITSLDGLFTWQEGIICMAGLIIYLNYAVKSSNNTPKEQREHKIGIKTYGILLLSCVLLFFSAKYTVISVIRLSEIFSIGTEVITASAVALGTSLPEVITCAVAAKKGNVDLGIGTLMGSNIFNAFAIMGISSFIGPLAIPQNMINFGIYMLIAATLMFYFVTKSKEITKWEGSLLILFYILFISKLFSWF